MAVIGNRNVDLIDVYKQQDGTRGVAEVVEMLSKYTSLTNDANYIECNSGTRHKTSVRKGLPSVTWGKLYKGVPQSKSEYTQVEDTTGFLEGESAIDARLLKIAKDKAKVRLNEAQGFLQSMATEMEETLIYGSTSDNQSAFDGFAVRFGTLSNDQVVDAGGTGADNTSVWFITWGDSYASLLYPEGTTMGIDRVDRGEERVTDANGDAYYAAVETFTWHNGLTVRDLRGVVRIANIDVSELEAGNLDIYAILRKGYYKLHNRERAVLNADNGAGRIFLYANSTVLEAMDAARTNDAQSDNYVRLTPGEVDGEIVRVYRNKVVVRECEAILNTEAALT